MGSVVFMVVLAVMAVFANLSPFVWGPNVYYLLSDKRPFARSAAYTVGRALTLVIAGFASVAVVLASSQGLRAVVDQAFAAAEKPGGAIYLLCGIALIGGAWWLYRQPDDAIAARFHRDNAGEGKLWPAFAFGITIALANLLGFVWQLFALGVCAAVGRNNGWFVLTGIVVWTVFGTIDLWAPALALAFAPEWSHERLAALTDRIPTLKPNTIALSIAGVGVALLAYGAWKVLAG
jgi:uncharacterized membrane protein YidH (DUF202 family)